MPIRQAMAPPQIQATIPPLTWVLTKAAMVIAVAATGRPLDGRPASYAVKA
ncbi:MAG: hypothetical protein QNJ94_04625 [Alphaproteobacteria bacterium]|nr:hypothetical protein [Alphaproteobacteria bacterium]